MKQRMMFWMAWGILTVFTAGCARVTTQVVEKPRVDQEIEGNQGYLAGTAPEAEPRKETRKVIQTDVELATWGEMNPWKVRKPAPESPRAAAPAAPAVSEPAWEGPFEEEFAPSAPVQPERLGTPYRVQKGDTLEKIAKKVYGDSNQWRRIYEANREEMKSPNRIYPGQELLIPPAPEESQRAPSGDLK